MHRNRMWVRWGLGLGLTCLAAWPIAAQDEGEVVVDAGFDLIYSVNRAPESPFETARAVQVITAEDIWRRNARTLPEVLMEEAGVFVQQTNYGSGSPIIRGQIGKQILILVDGVRVNNATYRFGSIQYLNTIDLAMVERIEIVRGVGSVLGGDAFGGSINIITRKGPGPAEERPFGSRLAARYSSADGAVTGRAEVFGRGDKVRYLVGATYRDSDDVEGGDRIGEQAATGYDEQAGNFNLEYFLSPDRTLSLGYQALEQNDVPRTDRIVDRTNEKFDFDPQRIQLLSLSFQDLTDRSLTDSLKVTAYWNRQDEGRQEIRSNRLTTERRHIDRQSVGGLNVEIGTFLGAGHRLVYGADYSSEDIVSQRRDVRLDTGAVTRARGNYTDGASYDSLAAYLQDRVSLGDRVTVALGARYSRFSASGSETSSVGTLKLDSSTDDLSGSLSLLVHVTEGLHLVAGVRRGFRAPNIDDLSVLDERAEGTEVPNADLLPEHALAYEVGAKFKNSRGSGSIYYHRTDLTDLLTRSAGTFQGLSFFDRNGNGRRDTGEPVVLQKQNIGEATIDGFEADFRYAVADGWSVFGNATDTTGNDEFLNVPLGRIPPFFGNLGVRWAPAKARREPWVEAVYSFADSQHRLAPVDVSDSRVGPGGTAGFDVFHLRGGCSLGERARLSVAAENLGDEAYKLHGSGVYRPGRQIVLGIEFRH